MVDILKMGSSSLLNMQQALSTTGHNIANVNTEGYNRQSVEFAAAKSQNLGFGFLGQGAKISNIERSYNQFLTTQVQDFTSSQSRNKTFVEFSARVDNILANSDNSLNQSLQKFFSAIDDVSANPSSLPERQVLIGEANNLVDRQRNFTSLLQDLNKEVNSELSILVTEVNGLADSITNLNKEVVSSRSSNNGHLPNDLLDQRDRLVKELSEKISVSVVEQEDGAINIFIGKGQALVVGSQSTHLQTQTDPYDASKIEIGIAGQINTSGVSQFVRGGEMQGLLDFRNQVLDQAEMQLGLVVTGLTENINQQHRLGIDLAGNQGGDFFKPIELNVVGNTNNVGSASPTATFTDVSQLRGSDYSLEYTGSQWQFTRMSDNTSTSGTGILSLDGMNIDVSAGGEVAGDKFIINPAKDGSLNFTLALSDPSKIAAASAVSAGSTLNNAGSAIINNISIDDVNSLPLSAPISLEFDPDALGIGVPGFNVSGGLVTTIAYDPNIESAGKNFNFPSIGLNFSIADIPQDGDVLTLNNNNGALGDNSNMLNMGELQQLNTLNGGQDTYQEFYGALVAEVGVTHRQASASLEVDTSLLEQAVNYRDSISGVNLDEEAANLIRYQQNYQAAAKLVQVADELFQTLLSSIR